VLFLPVCCRIAKDSAYRAKRWGKNILLLQKKLEGDGGNPLGLGSSSAAAELLRGPVTPD